MSADAPETTAVDLDPNLIASRVDGGRITDNILYFARLLRAAGLPVGPQKTVLATKAVLTAGVESPNVLYWALHACFVSHPSEHEIFDQAFHLYWRDPGYLEQMLSLMLPKSPGGSTDESSKELSRRLREQLFSDHEPEATREEDRIEMDAAETWSASEVFRQKDFEQMSAEELRQARQAIERMTLMMEEILTRRHAPANKGERLDQRRMLREVASKGPEFLLPRFKRRTTKRPPLVVLADISGSMDGYARMILHFLHALTNARDRVHSFLFGTRLTNVTRALKNKDADIAVAKVGGEVTDWSGGTRIGHSLKEFNRLWARRVLGQNATVLLITDGLDREGGEGLEQAVRRLRASSRRLIWLNPLFRYDDYAPIAAGARILARYAGETRACHNLASLEDLAIALSARRPASANMGRRAA